MRLVVLLLCGWVVLPGGGRAATPSSETRHQRLDREAAAFFAGPAQFFEITVPPKFADQLRREPRQPVPATVKVGTNMFLNVAIHLKGAAGSMRPFDDKPALTLNFDKFVDGQYCFGLDKLHLNNSVQDPSYLTECLASDLYLRSGVPTARAGHAYVKLNGRDLGLYVLKEGYNHLFLRRNFPSGTNALGNLYDPGFVRDIDQDLERDSSKGTPDYADLKRLREAVNAAPADRATRIRAILDVNRFLTFLAIQTLTDDWDGYGRNRNNYRLYFDGVTGRAEFIPHGMDQLFRDENTPLMPHWNGIVATRVMAVPEWRAQYRDRIAALSTNLFTFATLTNRIEEIESRLRPALAQRPPGEQRRLAREFQEERNKIAARVGQVQLQLANVQKRPPPEPWQPGQKTQQLTRWEPRTLDGTPLLKIEKSTTGDTLHLAAPSGGTMASFRALQSLPAGHYTFTGRARTQGLVARQGQRGAGAGIRISGSARENQMVGDHDWTPLSFEFDLAEESEVEFIAELRAERGEVWFDLASLKVTKK